MQADRPSNTRLALIGVGLIGGSIGLAARERGVAQEIVGFDVDAATLAAALERGALTEAAKSIEEAVAGSDVIVVACPVGQVAATAGAALRTAAPDAAVTDVGSTKRQMVAVIDDPRFVGGHPIAGAETAGVEHARADLFDGATWYLTPTERTAGVGLERLMRFISGLGARPRAIDAAAHDAMMAEVSHLPHVLANVLVSQTARALERSGEHLPVMGPSFRDATRVAGANSDIWTDIYVSNGDALASEIDALIARLSEVRERFAAGDARAITEWNEAAAADRRRLLEADLAGGPVCELRASVPNRPGVVAQVALELGRAGVNIVDMALYPAPDMRSGAITLWVAGEEAAERAQRLIADLGYPVARA